jgi:hypothetical protein
MISILIHFTGKLIQMCVYLKMNLETMDPVLHFSFTIYNQLTYSIHSFPHTSWLKQPPTSSPRTSFCAANATNKASFAPDAILVMDMGHSIESVGCAITGGVSSGVASNARCVGAGSLRIASVAKERGSSRLHIDVLAELSARKRRGRRGGRGCRTSFVMSWKIELLIIECSIFSRILRILICVSIKIP